MHVLYVDVILVILMKLNMLSSMVIYLASTPGNAVYDIEYWYTPYMSIYV